MVVIALALRKWFREYVLNFEAYSNCNFIFVDDDDEESEEELEVKAQKRKAPAPVPAAKKSKPGESLTCCGKRFKPGALYRKNILLMLVSES